MFPTKKYTGMSTYLIKAISLRFIRNSSTGLVLLDSPGDSYIYTNIHI